MAAVTSLAAGHTCGGAVQYDIPLMPAARIRQRVHMP